MTVRFICLYSITPEKRDEVIRRFRDSQGRPPAGVSLVGRWTRTDLSGGVAVVEAADPQALTAFSLGWSDLATIVAAPVVDDEELSRTLSAVRTR
jgi:hypothetical protein